MTVYRYDLTDLRLFLNVAEAGNITRGAERSNLSIGAASTRIKNLEATFGTALLSRNSQGTTVLPAGEVLRERALAVFRELEQLHGELQLFNGSVRGSIRIFANTTAITEILPTELSVFLSSRPHIDVELEERLSPDIAFAVAEGIIDMGILAGDVNTDGLDVLPYRRERLALVVGASHPLCNRGTIDFGEVLHENFITLQRESAIYSFANQVAKSHGVSLNIRIKVLSFDALCRMVEAEVGVGLAPTSVALRLKRKYGIRVLQLSDEWADRALRICVRDRRALPTFTRELVDFLASHAPSGQLEAEQD